MIDERITEIKLRSMLRRAPEKKSMPTTSHARFDEGGAGSGFMAGFGLARSANHGFLGNQLQLPCGFGLVSSLSGASVDL